MSKIIIHNRSSLRDEDAVRRVASVIEDGKCSATVFNQAKRAVIVGRNKGSYRFEVLDVTEDGIRPKKEETV